MTKETVNKIEIDPNAVVRVKRAGNVVEVLYSQKRSNGGVITKLSAEHYVDNRTGEVCNFEHRANRAEDKNSLQKTFAKIRDTINTNVTDPKKCRMLTLTYKENMRDTKKLRFDFGNFCSRCREEFGDFEYIAVAEPQGRGAWHWHVIIIFPGKAPYIDNKTIAKLWRKGFVRITKLDDVDNVGAYLSAYLGDIPLEEYVARFPNAHTGEIKEVAVEENGKQVPKRYVKGARLELYPPSFHLFRYSKGIKKAEVEYMPYSAIKAELSDAAMTYGKTTELEDKETGFHNLLTREIYNTKRKKYKEN